MSDPKIEIAKSTGDAVAATTTLGTLLSLIPPIVAIFTLIWTMMRIYEMYTGLPFHKTNLMKKIRGEK